MLRTLSLPDAQLPSRAVPRDSSGLAQMWQQDEEKDHGKSLLPAHCMELLGGPTCDPPEFSVGICCVFLHCCGWQNNITVMCAFPPLVTEENLFICFQSELLPKKCLEMGKKCALWRCTGGFLYENVYVFIVSCPGGP